MRRLENIDKKKARDQSLFTLAETSIRALGQAAEGAFAGAGLAMQGYLTGDAPAFALKSAAGIIFLDWLREEYPHFARLTHLDTLGFGTKGPPPPTGGKFCIRNKGAATRALVARGFGYGQELCYDTREERDAAITAFRDLYSGADIEEFQPG